MNLLRGSPASSTPAIADLLYPAAAGYNRSALVLLDWAEREDGDRVLRSYTNNMDVLHRRGLDRRAILLPEEVQFLPCGAGD
jgi:hypothetical protein